MRTTPVARESISAGMHQGLIIGLVGLVITVVVVGLTGWTVWRVVGGLAKASAQDQQLLATGEPALARILNLEMGGMTVTVGVHRQLQVVLSLEVHRQGAAPYAARLTTLISELQIPQLQPGAWVRVRLDPSNPARLALESAGQPPPGAPYAGQAPAGVGGAVPLGAAAPWGGAPVGVPIVRAGLPTGAKIGLLLGVGGAIVGVLAAAVVVAINVGGFGLERQDDLSDVCGRAAACCKVVSGDTAGSCNNLKKLGVPKSACESSLQGFQQSAQALGKTCP